ncbi:MAG TPA: ATP-binding protein [Anaerolineae bacterium]|nr:ATP-binding protein [Anaerolineae bacterium]
MKTPAAGLRARLTLSHLAVIVVAMGLSGFLLLSLLERYFVDAMEESLAAQARITAQALVPGATAEGPEAEVPLAAFNAIQNQRASNLSIETQNVAPLPDEFPGEIDLDYLAGASFQLSSQLDTRIRVVDPRGLVLFDSQEGTQGTDLSDDAVVAQALAGQYASRQDRASYVPAVHVAFPLLVDERLVGAVYLSQPLGDALAVVGDLRNRWLLSTVVALLFSGAVGLVLSRAVANPLRRLTGAARAVAHGDLDQQVPVASRDEVGELSRAFNDMTARLRAARQMQTDFVANVSHELRTPLTAVKGTVETLRDGAVDDPEVRDRFLETVERETDRLIRLVNDLLVLSRADSAALELRREEIDLGELAEETADRLAHRARAHDVTLAVEAAAGLRVPADRDRIEQVIVNLLDNAIKYSPPTRTVRVRAVPGSDGTVRVEVEDEGIGIPPEELARIGERFYRADRARSRAEGGSGLGLAIARALVEAHGGELWLESEVGEGTRACFTLPGS